MGGLKTLAESGTYYYNYISLQRVGDREQQYIMGNYLMLQYCSVLAWKFFEAVTLTLDKYLQRNKISKQGT